MKKRYHKKYRIFLGKPIAILSKVPKYLDKIVHTQIIKCIRKRSSTHINTDSEATKQ